jgi:iron only hydrogenase large subunit-like protein
MYRGRRQPQPIAKDKVKKRIESLYKIDDESEMRRAHENPVVKDFFEYAEKLSHEDEHAILHTSYSRKKRGQ